jgi:STE24 endopeptidase
VTDPVLPPGRPLKRTPGLWAALAAAALVYALLFVLTTFPQSPEAQARAARYFTSQEIDKGLHYAHTNRLLFWSSTAVQLLFICFVVFSGFARRLTDACARLLPRPRPPEAGAVRPGRWARFLGLLHWLGTVLLVGAFCFLVEELLVLPLRWGALENARAWGLTKRSVGSWLSDYAVSLGVAAGVGAVLLVGMYLLIRLLPRWWWAVAAGGSVLVAFCYAFLVPELINPLFNTFTPLRDPDLLRRVRALAERAGVPVQTVLVMDASRQGEHTNAYFTGFGSTRRIVLYDTLLRPLDRPPAGVVVGIVGSAAGPGGAGPLTAAAVAVAHRQAVADEIESVLAHEIGHWKHDHILKAILLAGVEGFAGMFLIAVLLRWAVGRAPFALRSPWDPAGLPLVLLVGVFGAWVTMPVHRLVSRHFERQADAVALELANRPEAFIAAEKRLARDNLSNVAPTPLSVWLFASHPPAVERIEMAEEWRRTHK